MNLSMNGFEVLHYFEQCRLKAYPDPGSPRGKAITAGHDDTSLSGAPWTIGWGDTGPDVVEGLTITQNNADVRLSTRMNNEFEPGVTALVKAPCTQGQFDGMCDLAYNIGLNAFKNSTLLQVFNRGLISSAGQQIAVWNKSGGKVMLGLRRRRAADKALFDGQSGKFAIALAASLR